ncbi:HD domain-containing protein [candidate division WOR-3 bacterium]|uniref:HD domain-containing protein n=1 Tax=candidate division WOR-3 bacterium TaxID=2052148 RepID=A0A9D5QD88_UNCW3|nr:HD domain-containing protein [candidate division WOR-3 bacterium]MBD3363825.1 HD domain-containing protein [candidate division WOR-3 bacterium]
MKAMRTFGEYLSDYKMQHMNHSVNTMFLATAFLKFLKKSNGIPQDLADRIEVTLPVAALFHDIGKSLIPNYILEANGEDFTDNERRLINEHTANSYILCRNLFSMKNIEQGYFKKDKELIDRILDGVKYHHTPYKDNPPFEAQIIALADSFLAITEGRRYSALARYIDAGAIVKRMKHSSNGRDALKEGLYNPELFERFLDFLRINSESVTLTKRSSFRFCVRENRNIALEIYNFDEIETLHRGTLLGRDFPLRDISFYGMKIADSEDRLADDIENQERFHTDERFKFAYVVEVNKEDSGLEDVPFKVFMYAQLIRHQPEDAAYAFSMIPIDPSVWFLFLAKAWIDRSLELEEIRVK